MSFLSAARARAAVRLKTLYFSLLTERTRSRYAEKNISVSPAGMTPPPTSGEFIQSVLVGERGKQEKTGREEVEDEVEVEPLGDEEEE